MTSSLLDVKEVSSKNSPLAPVEEEKGKGEGRRRRRRREKTNLSVKKTKTNLIGKKINKIKSLFVLPLVENNMVVSVASSLSITPGSVAIL